MAFYRLDLISSFIFFYRSFILDSDSLIDSQVVHKKNYTNGYEKGDEPNGNNMDEQQQEYLINPNEKMYPLEIPVGSIMKLKSNKNLTQLLPKIGKTLEVTLLFSLDIENFFLDMDDESDEGYNIPLDELQIEINAADKNHMKITELPGEFVCLFVVLNMFNISMSDNLTSLRNLYS